MRLPANIERILVIKPSSLGDIFHVFPALELLRRRFPAAELDFLIHPAFAEILDYSPWPVSRRILFERKRMGRLKTMLPEFVKLIRALRERRYDLVIDFQGLTRSALFARLARHDGPVIGFAAPREAAARLGYTLRLPVVAGHAVERNVGLINALFGSSDAPPLPELPRIAANAEQAELLMPGDRPLIFLLPGARWESKRFPPWLFAQSILEFRKRRPEFRFGILGGSGDREIEAEILRLAGPEAPIVPLAGKTTLGVTMELLRRADLVISNDSGPIHAAAALGKRIIGFFGPTLPEKTGPYGGNSRILRAEGLDCLGCLRRECPKKSGETLRCHRLQPETVAEEMVKLLEFHGMKPADRECEPHKLQEKEL